jgi:hypothetical protein
MCLLLYLIKREREREKQQQQKNLNFYIFKQHEKVNKIRCCPIINKQTA